MTAVILIDSDSNRLLAKYFEPAHQDPKLASQFKHPFQTLKEQRAFEAGIFEKTRRATGPFPFHVCALPPRAHARLQEIGRASCRERVS